MIYDCFIFNDEVELLKLRMMETYDLVDKFVLVEARYNWQLKPKPLFYDENKDEFAKWSDKIVHVIADPIPLEPFPVTESAQRDYMAVGLEGAGRHDTVIISDADELISREALIMLRETPPTGPVALQQILYYYYVNCRQNQTWFGPVALPRGTGKFSPSGVRAIRDDCKMIIPNAGWHFSWQGDEKRLQYKLSCHTIKEDSSGLLEPPDIDDVEHLTECITTGKDILHRTDVFTKKKFVEIAPGEDHPETILEWLEEYPYFAAAT